jgi:predicted  nucleic acid-binding Zn-ribbon protein
MEMKKWQEKHEVALKDLQSKESSLQRMEMELDRTRHELERAKMAADKADSSRALHQEQTEKLHREIENWKDKCNKAQIDVTEAEIRYLFLASMICSLPIFCLLKDKI